MIQKHTHKNLTWVDLESPTEAEVKEVMNTYGLHPLVAEELLIPTQKTKVESHAGYLYFILHFPQEVDFVIGKNFIITSRFATVEPLMSFSKIFEVNSIIGKETMADHAGHVFYYMLKKLYRHIGKDVESIKDNLCDIENHIFSGKEREMVIEISKHSRQLLDYKQMLQPHKQTLESIGPFAAELFGANFSHFMNTVEGEYGKVIGELNSSKEFLADLRDTNDSLLTTKQNETLKLFTILAFVTFPLALVVDILTVPFESNPIMGHPQAFWIIVVVTLAISVSMFAYFKHKKWL